MAQFDGKTILVTGAGSGIGAASARQLAAEGARVAVLDVTLDTAAATCGEIEQAGGRAFPLVADICDEMQMRAAFDALVTAAGGLDGIVACAGINGVWAPIDDLSPAEWDRTVAINLRGTYLTLHLGVPHLKAAGSGAIVIVASINGTRTFTTAGTTAYSATKAAQVAISYQLALELSRDRIRVNVICPGYTRTGIGRSTTQRNTSLIQFPADYPEGDVPLTGGLPATAEDIAQSVLFLMSDHARHITGTPLYVDGGQSILR